MATMLNCAMIAPNRSVTGVFQPNHEPLHGPNHG